MKFAIRLHSSAPEGTRIICGYIVVQNPDGSLTLTGGALDGGVLDGEEAFAVFKDLLAQLKNPEKATVVVH